MTDSGPGAITPDGCAVEVYRLLPEGNEPGLVHALAPRDATVLDLGAGVGRIAEPLARLGHHVVAVDNSPEMLSHIVTATTLESSIEALRLDVRFDVVLLASHLVNTTDSSFRASLFATIAHHLTVDGLAMIQWHPPEWFESLEVGRTYRGALGQLSTALEVHSLRDDELCAGVRYTTGEDSWTQTFSARRLSRLDVSRGLNTVGIKLLEQTPDPDWLLARPGRRKR